MTTKDTKTFNRSEFLAVIDQAVRTTENGRGALEASYTTAEIVAAARELGADEATIQRAVRAVPAVTEELSLADRLRAGWHGYWNARAIAKCLRLAQRVRRREQRLTSKRHAEAVVLQALVETTAPAIEEKIWEPIEAARRRPQNKPKTGEPDSVEWRAERGICLHFGLSCNNTYVSAYSGITWALILAALGHGFWNDAGAHSGSTWALILA